MQINKKHILYLVPVLLVGFLAYFFFLKSSNCFQYGPFKVCKEALGYATYYKGEEIVELYYPPNVTKEVEIPFFINACKFFDKKKVYVLFYANKTGNYSAVVGDFLIYKLPQIMLNCGLSVRKIAKGCLENNSLCQEYDLPVVKYNCSNNNYSYVIFNWSNNPSVELKGNCIILNANQSTYYKVYSAFIYRLMKIS